MKSGNVFLVDGKKAAGRGHVYLELVVDWIEPLELKAESDEIRVASLVGSAQVTLPGSPGQATSATPLTLDQRIPVGSVIEVGPDGCVGLDIAGRHAICLIPGTISEIVREFKGGEDEVLVRLQTGAVFSHVNLDDQPTDFRVQTPLALAAARGTDFVTVALPDVTDVWIQEGTVELLQPDGTPVGTVSSDNGGSPKILRFPPSTDDIARIRANSKTLTAAATLIPKLNARLPEIRQKQAEGQCLTAAEQSILDRAQRMNALIRVEAVGSP